MDLQWGFRGLGAEVVLAFIDACHVVLPPHSVHRIVTMKLLIHGHPYELHLKESEARSRLGRPVTGSAGREVTIALVLRNIREVCYFKECWASLRAACQSAACSTVREAQLAAIACGVKWEAGLVYKWLPSLDNVAGWHLNGQIRITKKVGRNVTLSHLSHHNCIHPYEPRLWGPLSIYM